MIRIFEEQDLNEIADIWLNTNIKAHPFIPAEYWQYNFEFVKKIFLQAEIYVYENQNIIQGFIGLQNNYLAGIFVRTEFQSKGVGKQLMDYAKAIKPEIRLNVYKKNIKAIRFYQREKYKIIREKTDEHNGEKEYIMLWKK